ncbi:hypothetical protein IW261DRAFT_1596030 [Armillaria novae-zelandiae]|uniref:GST N-terminal domain-containing protein n=1 Tax=Armillaria novae-zelandiae TaxID=153914 RepID=A0AA39NYJ4_9AGAR|nr:hypothetical protein IW261DRAFT_1596030 [Armillaria novae-zelandiae]
MITLYDLPSKVADSPGTMMTWRTRYCLSLKNLPYQTVYVEIPDVKILAKKIGAAPTTMWPDGSPKYTIPIIQDHSTGAVVSDSPAIAAYLDKIYPSSGPVLIPSETMVLQLAFTDAVEAAFEHLRLPLFYADFVTKMNNRSAAPLKEIFGAKLKAPEGEEREKMWATTRENLGEMNKWFEGSGGDFVMGDEPCFADTVISAFFWLIRNSVGRESEEWKDIVTWHDGRWGKHLDRFKQYEIVV